jgi:hypothetical protein
MMALRDLAVEEGYAPPQLLEQVEQIGVAANEFRRDCINLLLGEGDVSKDQILDNVKKTVKQVEEYK